MFKQTMCLLLAAMFPLALPADNPTGKGKALYGHDICIEGNPSYESLLEEINRTKQNGGNYVDLRMRWKDLESTPFQYDFSRLDQLVAQCRKIQMPYLITVFHGGAWRNPDFLKDCLMRDQKGRESGSPDMQLPTPNRYGSRQGTLASYSLHAEKVMKHYEALYKAIIERYKDDPLLIGYSVPFGKVDVLYQDSTGNRWIFDYSEWARKGFIEFLRDEKKYSLPDVNRRNGTDWKSWNDVTLPQPVFDRPDLRPAWQDFQEFKNWGYLRNLERRLKVIRDNDPNPDRRIYVWGQFNGPLEPSLPIFRKYDALPNFSGFEGSQNHYLAAAAQRAGVSCMAEPAEIPPSPRSWGRSIFHAMSYGCKGIMWVFHMRDASPALPLFRQYRDAFERLSDATRPAPQAASLFSYTSHFHEQPGFILWDWRNFYVVNDQIACSIRAGMPIDYLGSEASEFDNLSQYKLFLEPGAPIIKHRNVEQLERYVKNGGYLVLQGDSAQVELESGKPYPLLAALGIPSPLPEPHAKFLPAKPVKDGMFGALPVIPLRNVRKLPVPPGPFRVAATAQDGSPAAVEWKHGKGSVLLLAGNIYWSWRDTRTLTALLDALMARTGIRKYIETESQGTVEASLVTLDGDYYAILFNNSGKETSEPLNVKLRLPQLPEGVYRLEGLIAPFPARTCASAELELGISLNLNPVELQVIRLSPAKTETPRSYAVPTLAEPPAPETWKRLPFLTGGVVHATGKSAQAAWRCRFARDEKAFYFSVTCDEPTPEKIRAALTAPGSSVWNEDSIELFLDIGAARRNAAQLAVNAAGTVSTNPLMPDTAWIATARDQTSWSVQGRIPFVDFGVLPPVRGERWGFNVRRNRFAGGAGETANLFDTPDYPHAAEHYGTLVF